MIDRSEWIEKRKQISSRDLKNEQIARRVLPFLKASSCIGYFYPVRQEADIFSLRDPGWTFVLPRVLDKTKMAFYDSTILKPGGFGIPEPVSDEEIVPDVLVIPLLVFCDGYRIGYGGGYYDRYLEKHPECLRIGIAFDEQEGQFEPESWDQRLDWIITPTRTLHYDRNGQ